MPQSPDDRNLTAGAAPKAWDARLRIDTLKTRWHNRQVASPGATKLLQRFRPPHRPRVNPALVGLCGLVSLGVGYLALQAVHHRAEQTLQNSLGRPVQLGAWQGFSRRGLRLGKTIIPAASQDGFSGQIDAIDLGLKWRKLQPGQRPYVVVTLVRPEIWLVPRPLGSARVEESITADGPAPRQPGRSPLGLVQVQDGRLTLTPATTPHRGPRPGVTLARLEGTVWLPASDEAVTLSFEGRGQVGQGRFWLDGSTDLTRRRVKTSAQAHNLSLTDLNGWLPALVNIQDGLLNGSLSLSATLTAAGTPVPASIDLRGLAIVQAGQMQLGQLAEPLSGLQSHLLFQGQRVTVHHTGLRLGKMALWGEGSIALDQGYNLLARLPPIAVGEIQALEGSGLSLEPSQVLDWQAQMTGPLNQPQVDIQPSPPLAWPSNRLELTPNLLGITLGMNLQGLPARHRIDLIEGATYEFRRDGAWFTLSDGTVVPPLSESAYGQGAARFPTALDATLDRKFFWLLQTSPYLTAIAADLAEGKLDTYRVGNRFDTDRFFLEYFLPIYVETSLAAGLDPGESLWMLDHSLRTLQDPLLRNANATPIIGGAGMVGSFWAGEQVLSMQQLMARPFLSQPGRLGQLARLTVLKQLNRSASLASRRLSSTPEVMSKLPNVTFGAEEGAIALALGMIPLAGRGIYPEAVTNLAEQIEQNERAKQALRTSITHRLRLLATEQTLTVGSELARWSDQDWQALGLGRSLFPDGAANLNGTNTLSVLVSRSEKAGYPLEQAYQASRALLLELLAQLDQTPNPERVVFAILKDQAFNPSFWSRLSAQQPALAPQIGPITRDMAAYGQLAAQGVDLHNAFYTAMVQSDQDIGVSAAIKQAVGFQAHLGRLLDQALDPSDRGDPRYLAFRRSLAIYLREAPDIAVYGGSEAALRAYGQETLNVQELIAVETTSAPRIRALARLYREARAANLIEEWDRPGFQRILVLGAMLAAGVERQALPEQIGSIGFPSAQFRQDLLFVVGAEGINTEATRLGVQAHDYRVAFQPLPLPGYREPSFQVTDPNACPTQPVIAAIALGPGTQFTWDAAAQRVVLQRNGTVCPLSEAWASLNFPVLLETVPIVHSEAGSRYLQAKFRAAQQLEAGIF